MPEELIFSCIKNHFVPLSHAGTTLAPLKKEHMEQIRLWRNEQLSILRQKSPLSQESQQLYWEKTLSPNALEKHPPLILFSIIQGDYFLGYTGLTHIDWTNKRAEISFLIDTKIPEENNLFQIIFSSILEALEKLAFHELGLDKLIAEVFAFRKPVIALLKQACFIKEGYLFHHIHKGDKVFDSFIFAKRKHEIPPQALLVTSLSQKIPLIHALRESVGALGKPFHIIGCDSDPQCLGQHSVDAFWNSPSWESAEAQEKLLLFCKEHNVVGIIPTRDQELSFFANMSSTFQENGISLLTSPLKTLRICQDKWAFMLFCKEHALPYIPTYLTLEELPQNETHFIIKERYSFSPKRFYSFTTRDVPLPILQNPIFQPKVEGVEYSIDVYRSRRTQEVRALVRRRDIVIGSEAYFTTPVVHVALESAAKRAAECLEIEGHALFQAIETKGQKLYFIECNPRIGGASTASFNNGLNSIEWFIQEEILQQPLPPFLNNLPHFAQLRMREDIALVSGPDIYQ